MVDLTSPAAVQAKTLLVTAIRDKMPGQEALAAVLLAQHPTDRDHALALLTLHYANQNPAAVRALAAAAMIRLAEVDPLIRRPWWNRRWRPGHRWLRRPPPVAPAILRIGPCTGVSAGWCPNHGTCSCPDPVDPAQPKDLNHPKCPLHRAESTHAEHHVDG